MDKGDRREASGTPAGHRVDQEGTDMLKLSAASPLPRDGLPSCTQETG